MLRAAATDAEWDCEQLLPWSASSQPRIDGLAFKCKNAENTFMNRAQ